MVVRGWGAGGNGEGLLGGQGISFGDHENVKGVDGGDGCTVL